MSMYNDELGVIGFNNELKDLLECRIDYRKKAIYIRDTSGTDVKNGYILFKQYQSGYKEELLVIDIKKKISKVIIYVMRV